MSQEKLVIVTGAAGFIGSNLVRLLLQDPAYRVIGFDKLTYAGNVMSLADLSDNSRFSLVTADICDGEFVSELLSKERPDAIMHLAAESHVDRSIDAPGEFITTNVVGTYELLQASLDYVRSENRPDDFRFLHVSTDEVYGSLSPDAPAFTEQTPYDPHSPYSASKASSDHLVRAWFDTYGLPVLITNCSNNYGPFQFPEKLIPVVLLRCLRSEPIPIYGAGENIRDWLYVEDHCRALKTVLEEGTVGETFNIGGDNEKTNLELVTTICRMLDHLMPRNDSEPYESLITFVTDRPGHDKRYSVDASKIQRELGWAPIEDATSGLHKTIQWYLDNQHWWEAILNGSYRLERLGLQNEEEPT